ncbi:hypothetical protein AK812_SmicGene1920 [Symbiodinium microadriaticum]|uniref:ABC1 atypical kinase-like domain-containing protein n=1 Tax=Symbiodinium microadriaticum TaxID=2951 RepID=A0A1Q9F2Q0_SYMMI|nr:hypothetical protein AK812_SmicGene1920 [Symbiodinium microadriaticum]
MIAEVSIACTRSGYAEVHSHSDDAVQSVQTTCDAFAAIRGDGSVVTWGSELDGADSSLVTAQLNTVVSIQATDCAFAAIRGDGTVVTWGSELGGGDSSRVQDQLKNVVAIQASELAFAALLADGSVVTWGFYANGGDSSSVQEQLKHGVYRIQKNKESFAAIKRDGTVVTWGGQKTSLDFRCIAVAASWWAFAAITEERRVVTWGEAAAGGDSTSVEDRLRDVLAISASERAFAALLFNGSVVTWGDADNGGDSSAVQDQLKHVRHISASGDAFAAILENGKVVTWGDPLEGGDSSAVREQLKSHVRDVQATCGAFAAIKEDGSVVTWGEESVGGDSSAVQDQLYSIEKVQAGRLLFVAVSFDSRVVAWSLWTLCGPARGSVFLVRSGFFNTDPHPGNLAVDDKYPGGRLIFYDFGQACELTDGQADGILQVIQSIVDFEAKDCVKAMDSLGCLKEGTDFKAVEGVVQKNFETGKVKSKRSKRKRELTEEEQQKKAPKQSEVMKYFQLPPALAFVSRAITQMQGVGVDYEFIDFVADKVPELQVERGAGISYIAGQLFKNWVRA